MAILSNIWNIKVDRDFTFDPDLLKIRINLNISKLYKVKNFTLVSLAFECNPSKSIWQISSNLQ